jgi:hypothetical protein
MKLLLYPTVDSLPTGTRVRSGNERQRGSGLDSYWPGTQPIIKNAAEHKEAEMLD